ncbi:MAG: CRTAC1 family protein [Myxococcota bacterium]
MIVCFLLLILSCSHVSQDAEVKGSDSSASYQSELADHEFVDVLLLQRATFVCEEPVANARPIQEKSLGLDWDHQRRGGDGELHGWGVMVHDWNGDGRWDVYLPQFGADELFFGLADRSVSQFLINGQQMGMGGAAADLDADGQTDLVLANLGVDQILFQEPAGIEAMSFVSHPWSDGDELDYRTQHVALGDGNGDGLLDVFGATFFTDDAHSDVPVLNPNLLFLAQEDGFWSLQDWPENLQMAPANAGGWVDIDNDGQLELFVINDKPHSGYRCGVLSYQDTQWVQWDNAHGLNIAIEGMGLAWGDLNLDGQIDFGITGWSEHALLIGNGALEWYEASQAWNLNASEQRVVAWGIEFVDMDNDGDQDVLVAYGPAYSLNGEIGHGNGFPNTKEQYLSLYLNHGNQLELVSNTHWDFGAPGNFRGFAIVDWNLDGYPDVIARDLSRQARYYESNCGHHKAIHISLSQNGQNPDAIGARIWIESNGIRQFRDIVAGSTNIASSGPPVAYFGVGDAEVVDLWIHWPDGKRTEVSNVATGQWIDLARDD